MFLFNFGGDFHFIKVGRTQRLFYFVVSKLFGISILDWPLLVNTAAKKIHLDRSVYNLS